MKVLKSSMGTLTRRRFLDSFLLGTFLVIPSLLGGCASGSSNTETRSNIRTGTENKFGPRVENNPVPFRWEVSAADIDKVKNNLQFQGEIRPSTTKGVSSYIVGGILIYNLAKGVLKLVRDLNYGGTVIDMRGSEIIITNDKGLPGNVIVIISQDGPKVYQVEEFDTVSALATLFRESLSKSH